MSDTLLDAARQALEWYRSEAEAIAKHFAAGNDMAVLASVQVLSLDGGRRAEVALAEAENEEPVGWVPTDEIRAMRIGYQQSVNMRSSRLDPANAYRMADITMLYTHPPKREPLTDEQIAQCIVEARVNGPFARAGTTSFRIARAVERAHGIGGSNE